MPYVITTRRPATLPHGEHPYDYGYPMRESRRAVATLEEARARAAEVAKWQHDYPGPGTALATIDQARKVPESGGTIGPLPDGTVIKVEHVSRHAFADMLAGIPGGLIWPARDDTVLARQIDAFNARERVTS